MGGKSLQYEHICSIERVAIHGCHRQVQKHSTDTSSSWTAPTVRRASDGGTGRLPAGGTGHHGNRPRRAAAFAPTIPLPMQSPDGYSPREVQVQVQNEDRNTLVVAGFVSVGSVSLRVGVCVSRPWHVRRCAQTPEAGNGRCRNEEAADDGRGREAACIHSSVSARWLDGSDEEYLCGAFEYFLDTVALGGMRRARTTEA